MVSIMCAALQLWFRRHAQRAMLLRGCAAIILALIAETGGTAPAIDSTSNFAAASLGDTLLIAGLRCPGPATRSNGNHSVPFSSLTTASRWPEHDGQQMQQLAFATVHHRESRQLEVRPVSDRGVVVGDRHQRMLQGAESPQRCETGYHIADPAGNVCVAYCPGDHMVFEITEARADGGLGRRGD